MENVNLQVQNYKCSEKQNREIKSKLEFLVKQIPCSSRVILDFDYKDKIFYGKLKVNFNGRSFFSKGKDVLLTSLTSSLCKKLQKQVMKWKKSRTVEEITGVIALSSYKKEEKFKLYPYKKVG